MTALAAPLRSTISMPQKQSKAAGKDAKTTEKMLIKALQHARNNASDWRPVVKALIEEIASECQSENWDGYGAKPILEDAIRQAQRFVDLLPYHLLAPDPIPDPDGEIALCWDLGRDRIFTVSVNASGTLYFAGLIGKGVKRNGMELFKDDVPKIIIDTIEELGNKFGPIPRNPAP